jgi:hypothetical protein
MKPWLGGALAGAMLLSAASAFAAEKGSVTFVVRDDRGNDVDAKITLDDDATAIPVGRLQTLEPGIHDVHWSVASGAAGVQKLTVIEGQQGRIFQIIANLPPPPPSTPAFAAAPANPAVLAPVHAESSRSGPWPYLLLGGGATLALASAVFQLVALNEDSDSQHYFWTSTREDLAPETRASVRAAGSSHYDAAQTDQTIALTCGILAVTAVTVAVTWLLIGHK